MKTKIDWQNFNPADEVAAVAKYIEQTWTGFTAQQASQIAELGFMRGWECYGDHYDYVYYQGKQISGTRLSMEREKTLLSLGYPAAQVYDDAVCHVLESFDALVDHQEKEASFVDHFGTLVKDARKLIGPGLTKVRPAGWNKSPAPEVMEGASPEQFDAFEGSYTSSALKPHFIDCIAMDNVKYHLVDYKPYQTLLSALYGHAVLARKMFNSEKMGAALTAIDTTQPVVGKRGKVKVMFSPWLELLFSRASTSNQRAKQSQSLIEWVQAPSNTSGTPGL